MSMKRILFLFLLFATAILSSCSKDRNSKQVSTEADNPKNLPSSGGKTLEMILVSTDDVYKGSVKDSIGTYFQKACDGINQPEPLFDLVHILPSNFNNSDMFQKHRNILIIDVNKNNANKVYKNYNYKAFPQAYFEVSVTNYDSLFSLIRKFAPIMINKFYENEYRRIGLAFKKLENIEATKKLKNTFKFSLTISNEFSISIFNDDFAWLKKDYMAKKQQRTLNIMVHKIPYIGQGMFKEEKIIELRDKISKQYIAGPLHGSYMGTEKRFSLTRKNVNINGQTAVETRGLWRLFNDFMGGPFINYCFFDQKNNQFIMIDCFVYSPNQPKRDELIQLESIVYSLKFE